MPQHVIVTVVCVVVGVVAGFLVRLAPAVWLPMGAGIATTGLLLALHGLWRERH